MSVPSSFRPTFSGVPVVPSGAPAAAARGPVQPMQPRVLQSARAPGQLSFVFRR
ncbi:MAG: hypothetical protein ACK4PH_03895 [Aquincola tertiaricarbonis]